MRKIILVKLLAWSVLLICRVGWSQEVTFPYKTLPTQVSKFVLSADSQLVANVGIAGQIKVHHLQSGELLAILEDSNIGFQHAVFGKKVLCGIGYDGIVVWKLPEFQVEKHLNLNIKNPSIVKPALINNEQQLLYADGQGLFLIDLKGGKLIQELSLITKDSEWEYSQLLVDQEEAFAYVWTSGNQTLRKIEIASFKEVAKIKVPNARGMTFSKAHELAVICSRYKSTLTYWVEQYGTDLQSIGRHELDLGPIAVGTCKVAGAGPGRIMYTTGKFVCTYDLNTRFLQKHLFDFQIDDFFQLPDWGIAFKERNRLRIYNQYWVEQQRWSGGSSVQLLVDRVTNKTVLRTQDSILSSKGEWTMLLQPNSRNALDADLVNGQLGTINSSGEVSLYDLMKKELVQSFSLSDHIPQRLHLFPEEGLMVTYRLDAADLWFWKLTTGELIKKLSLGSAHFMTSQNHFDELLIGAADGMVYRINPGKQTKIQELKAMSTPVTALGKSHDAEKLMVGARGRWAIFDTKDTTDFQVFRGHQLGIQHIQATKDGGFVLTTGAEGGLKLWETKTGSLLQNFDVPNFFYSNTFLDEAADKLLLLSDDIFLSELDFPSFKSGLEEPQIAMQTAHSSMIGAVVFNQDGSLLATLDAAGRQVKVWDTQSGLLINTFQPEENQYLQHIDFFDDQDVLIIANWTKVEYWDPVSGLKLKDVDYNKMNYKFKRLMKLPQHNTLVGIQRLNENLMGLQANTGDLFWAQQLPNVQEPQKPFDVLIDLELSADGDLMAVYGGSAVHLFDFANNENFHIVRDTLQTHFSRINDYLSLSPDKRFLAYLSVRDHEVVLYDLVERKEIKRIFGHGAVWLDNQKVVVATKNARDQVLLQTYAKEKNWEDIQEIRTGHINNITCMAYHPEPGLLVTGDFFGNLKFWDTKRGKERKQSNIFKNYVYGVFLAPNSDHLVYTNQFGLYAVDLQTFTVHRTKGQNYPYLGAFDPETSDYYYPDRAGNWWQMDLNTKNVRSIPFDWPDVSGIVLYPNDLALVIQTLDENQEKRSLVQFPSGKLVQDLSIAPNAPYSVILPTKPVAPGQFDKWYVICGVQKDEGAAQITLHHAIYDYSAQKLEKPHHILNTTMKEMTPQINTDATKFQYSPKGNYFLYKKDNEVFFLDPKKRSKPKSVYCFGLDNYLVSPDERFLFVYTKTGEVKKYDLETQALILEEKVFEGPIAKFSFKKEKLIVRGGNQLYKLLNADDLKTEFSLLGIGDQNLVVFNDEGYYLATKGGQSDIAFKVNRKLYPFEQFDLRFNRPDLILKQTGYADSVLTSLYHQAYLKRIKKMGFESLDDNRFDVPSLSVSNKADLPAEVFESALNLKVHASAEHVPLHHLNAFVNDVPIYGFQGIPLSRQNLLNHDTTLQIQLNAGANKIQFSVHNRDGIESYKETIYVEFRDTSARKPNLHFVGIGVGEFADTTMNLPFADDDVVALKTLFEKQSTHFEAVHSTILLNESVTSTAFEAVKAKLMNTQPDDLVVLYVAGHGIVDEQYQYYLATTNTDFDIERHKGIAYENIEDLLDGIPARKKLWMLDACHAGEIDSASVFIQESKQTSQGKIKFRNLNQRLKNRGIGEENVFQLMRSLFVDLRRGTGANIISSSSALDVALEGGIWNGGVFAYALKAGLGQMKADDNGDESITVSELFEYVSQEVMVLTDSVQKPDFRAENITSNFVVWTKTPDVEEVLTEKGGPILTASPRVDTLSNALEIPAKNFSKTNGRKTGQKSEEGFKSSIELMWADQSYRQAEQLVIQSLYENSQNLEARGYLIITYLLQNKQHEAYLLWSKFKDEKLTDQLTFHQYLIPLLTDYVDQLPKKRNVEKFLTRIQAN